MPNEKPKADSVQPSPAPVAAPAGPAEVKAPRRLGAWQPLTPRGIAAFGDSHAGRVWTVEIVVALLVAGTVAWFFASTWFPTVREAIRQLPDQGLIERGLLSTPYRSTEPLAMNRFLAILIETEQNTVATAPSDVRVQFHRHELRVCSLLGCLTWPYPPDRSLGLNRPEAEPWWGAWQPILLWMAGIFTGLGLLLTWNILAVLYAPLVWFLAYLKDRQLGLGGSWRVASVGMMPAALILTASLVAYALEAIDLIRLLGAFLLHFPLGWAFCAVAVLVRPRISDPTVKPTGNPFTGETPNSAEASTSSPSSSGAHPAPSERDIDTTGSS